MQSDSISEADEESNALLKAALEYAARGWPVFPCWWIENGRCACPKGAEPDHSSPGKHPIANAAPHGVKNAVVDPKQITKWWTRWPKANIGLATGVVSGLVVVDLDIKPGKNGVESLKASGIVPKTRTVRTGSGGLHLYFAHPGTHVAGSTGKHGIDVRADDNYVMAPGSNHISGEIYALEIDDPIVDLPPDLLARIRPAPSLSPPQSTVLREYPLAAPAELDLARSGLSKIGPAISGDVGHNKALAAAIWLWHEHAFTDDEAWPLFLEWNTTCQPPWIRRELEHKRDEAIKKSLDPAARLPAYGSQRRCQTKVTLKSLQLTFTAAKLRESPPPRVYDLTDDASGRGLLPRGKVGVLGAPGGVGKTTVLIQLAVAGATGSVLFGPGGWRVGAGKTLLILCEEDAEEIQRRIHYTLRDLDDVQAEAVAQSIVAFPLAGQPTDLISSADGNTFVETAKAAELRDLVRELRPDRILADPLSRLTIKENDNTAMRRVVQVLETLTVKEYGSPTVLVAAHTRKEGKDADPDSVDGIRGGKALTDSVRFVAMLEQMKRIDGAPDLLRLKVVKNNYGARYDGVMLCRPDDGFGMLRVATPDEDHRYSTLKSSKGGKKESARDVISGLILAELEAQGPLSANQLTKQIHKRNADVLQACNDLFVLGRIQKIENRWEVVPAYSREDSGTGVI